MKCLEFIIKFARRALSIVEKTGEIEYVPRRGFTKIIKIRKSGYEFATQY